MKRITVLKQTFRYCIHLTFRANGWKVLPYLLLQIVGASIPLLNIYVLQILLDRLAVSGRISEVMPIALTFCGLIGLGQINSAFSGYLSASLDERAAHAFERELDQKINHLPLSALDTSQGRDLIDDVTYVSKTVLYFLRDVTHMLMAVYTLAVALAALVKYNVHFTILFVALAVPGIIVDKRFDLKHEKLRMTKAPDVRKANYYKWMLIDALPGRDVRMYGLAEALQGRYHEEKSAYRKAVDRLARKKLRANLMTEALMRSGEIVFIAFVCRQALDGDITIGDASLYTGLAISFGGALRQSGKLLTTMLLDTVNQMERFFEFHHMPCPQEANGGHAVKTFQCLEFDNVYFRYPMQEEYVLKGVSFRLNKGDRLSIIGINGAGKTTIIKLMLGLYEVESGCIRINGHPLKECNITDVHNLYSVLFQQFPQYSLSLKENIALSDISGIQEKGRIRLAMEKSGIWDAMGEFIDKDMTKNFDDTGMELSKGQWQKVALARTYFKEAPVIVLDEPSSSLDAEAEDYVFGNYCSLSGQRTGIMISHRIYGARFSTKIVVLDGGKIVETGSHDELVKRDGFYAQLYRLQKEKYAV